MTKFKVRSVATISKFKVPSVKPSDERWKRKQQTTKKEKKIQITGYKLKTGRDCKHKKR